MGMIHHHRAMKIMTQTENFTTNKMRIRNLYDVITFDYLFALSYTYTATRNSYSNSDAMSFVYK